MTFSKNAWDQLRNKTRDELISALPKDGLETDQKLKTERVYWHPDGRRIIIHYHSGGRDYGSNLLKALLNNIGWSEDDMRRLRLIK